LHRREKVQLVAIGALTNIALLLILYPEVAPMIDITIMGGCLGIGAPMLLICRLQVHSSPALCPGNGRAPLQSWPWCTSLHSFSL